MSNLCFIDFETTGSNVFEDHPLEFGAVLVNKNFEIVNEFFSSIKPPDRSQNTATAFAIHNIKLRDLEDAPTSKVVLDDFFERFGVDYGFAGWNISFDVPFFRKLCYLNEMMDLYNKIDYRHIDVQTICKIARELTLIPGNIKSLDDCVRYFGLNRSKVHNALEDAKLTFSVFQALLKLLDNAVVI